MSQTIRQRQALNGTRRHPPMAVDVSQPRRVHCDPHFKPGRDTPPALRQIRHDLHGELDHSRHAPWGLFAGILVWTVFVTIAFGYLPLQ